MNGFDILASILTLGWDLTVLRVGIASLVGGLS